MEMYVPQICFPHLFPQLYCIFACLSVCRAGVIRKTHVVESSFFDVPLLYLFLFEDGKETFPATAATDQVDKETK
jgi:hypothetical protein